MKDEIASWIPENLLYYLESDAERKNMTLKEAVVQALRLCFRVWGRLEGRDVIR